MSFIYTRSQLKSRINAGIQGKIGMLVSAEDLMNEVVRELYAKLDFVSARRSTTLVPNLVAGIYDYACPADLKSYAIIDIPAQAKRSDGQWFLVPSEEFERQHKVGSIAIDDYNGIRLLKLSSRVDSKNIIISELDNTTSGGGTWALFGDAINVAADTDDFVSGGGSLSFDLSAAGGTTAGIQNSTLNTFDLTDYLGGNGVVFVWTKINSATNITNYILRIGTDSSNYYTKTATARHDGTAFVAGWNLLRFDLSSLTTVGTPTDTSMRYVALYMTKAAGKISETDYKFDKLQIAKGVIHNAKYYSSYGWQNSSGSYLLNSTSDTDVLVADEGEFNLAITAGIAKAAYEVNDDALGVKYDDKLKDGIKGYEKDHPSEAKIMTSEYYSY